MKKIAAIILTGSLALGSYGFLSASPGEYSGHGMQGKGCQHGKHGKYGKMRGERRLARMTTVLGLSKKQVEQIRAVKNKYRPQKMALRTAMRAEVNKILTAEQRAKKQKMHKGRHGRHHGHHGHR